LYENGFPVRNQDLARKKRSVRWRLWAHRIHLARSAARRTDRTGSLGSQIRTESLPGLLCSSGKRVRKRKSGRASGGNLRQPG